MREEKRGEIEKIERKREGEEEKKVEMNKEIKRSRMARERIEVTREQLNWLNKPVDFGLISKLLFECFCFSLKKVHLGLSHLLWQLLATPFIGGGTLPAPPFV